MLATVIGMLVLAAVCCGCGAARAARSCPPLHTLCVYDDGLRCVALPPKAVPGDEWFVCHPPPDSGMLTQAATVPNVGKGGR